MKMEYDHMDELGFNEDKQLVCTPNGFLSSANAMKRMCDRFIRNGGKLYDTLTAYDNISSYGLNREDRRSGDSLKTLVPLLKAAGVTDSSVYEFFMNDMALMPGSEVINYIDRLMTVSMVSETYEHHAMALCDSLKLPADSIICTNVSFDALEMEKLEAKKFREFTTNISKMEVPKITTKDDVQFLDPKDQTILETIDDLIERMNEADIMYQMGEIKPIGGNEKAFSLMDMKRRTEVDLNCTAYLGNNGTDYPAMDIVRDNEGLALSFNGDAYAVRGSNVAVMSSDSIVAAFLITVFYNEGLEGVYSVIDSWDRDKLAKREFSDRHLMNAMLNAFPARLPDVVAVNDDNIDDVIKESERFRKKLTI
jgi:predicted HAD superfamily phosphohydrolase